jgi:electron transfer flavoprotein alpha/beta subunit
MHVAALVKQVLGDAGTPEMDALGRRAVAQGVELAAAVGDGVCTVVTVGPPDAGDVLREAIAYGRTCSVFTDGLLLDDPAFAGGDTLATARTIAALASHEGPYDLVLLGAASSDVGTGQLGPQLAECLDVPFAASARYVSLQGTWLHVRCEHDDGWTQLKVPLPAVVSCAADLITPCEATPIARATVPPEAIRILKADDLGAGPWGVDASTASVRMPDSAPTTPVAAIRDKLEAIKDVLSVSTTTATTVPAPRPAAPDGSVVATIIEPGRSSRTRALVGVCAQLAHDVDGHVIALVAEDTDASTLGSWGADRVVEFDGSRVEEDVARSVAEWVRDAEPWAVIAPASAWGREIAGRAAAHLGAGLAGNVHALRVDDGRLVASRRHGDSVLQIMVSSNVQFATLDARAKSAPAPRDTVAASVERIAVRSRDRVNVVSRVRSSAGD